MKIVVALNEDGSFDSAWTDSEEPVDVEFIANENDSRVTEGLKEIQLDIPESYEELLGSEE